MYLEIVNESSLAEMFGLAAVEPPRKLNATYLQRKWLQVLRPACRLAVQGSRLMCCNYRNFHVGGSAYCYCSLTGEFQIINSGNLKICKEWSKKCAEMTLLEMIPERFDCIIGFAIYGEEVQPDPSGHAPRTLHPCPECRALMDKDSRIKRWTRIYTFRPWSLGDPPEERRLRFVREHMSFQQLKRVHASQNVIPKPNSIGTGAEYAGLGGTVTGTTDDFRDYFAKCETYRIERIELEQYISQ